jgi:hypothetical protein
MKLSCCALVLGSAIFAAKQLGNGHGWDDVEKWQESPAHHFAKVLKFGETTDSVVKFWDSFVSSKKRKKEELRWSEEPAHYDCGISRLIKTDACCSYRRLEIGLKLSRFGNRAYRAGGP